MEKLIDYYIAMGDDVNAIKIAEKIKEYIEESSQE